MTGFDWLDERMNNYYFRRPMYDRSYPNAYSDYMGHGIPDMETDEEEDNSWPERDEGWDIPESGRRYPNTRKPERTTKKNRHKKTTPNPPVQQSSTVPTSSHEDRTPIVISSASSPGYWNTSTINPVSSDMSEQGKTTALMMAPIGEESGLNPVGTKTTTILVATSVSVFVAAVILLAVMFAYLRNRRRQRKARPIPIYDEIQERTSAGSPSLSQDQPLSGSKDEFDFYNTIESSTYNQVHEPVENIQCDTGNVYDHLEHFSRNPSESEDTVPKSGDALDDRSVRDDDARHTSNSTGHSEYDHAIPVVQGNGYYQLERTNGDEHKYLQITPTSENGNDNHKYFVLEPQGDKGNESDATEMQDAISGDITNGVDDAQSARNRSGSIEAGHEYFVLDPDYVDDNAIVTQDGVPKSTTVDDHKYYTLEPCNK